MKSQSECRKVTLNKGQQHNQLLVSWLFCSVCVCMRVCVCPRRPKQRLWRSWLSCSPARTRSSSAPLYASCSTSRSTRHCGLRWSRLASYPNCPRCSVSSVCVTVCVCCVSLVVHLCGLRLQVQLLTALQREFVALCHQQRGGASVTGRSKPLQGRLG